jgi:hypothetical protein
MIAARVYAVQEFRIPSLFMRPDEIRSHLPYIVFKMPVPFLGTLTFMDF